jgi:hypothetical protein
MRCYLLKFTVVLNSVLLFWKLLAFEFLLGTSETLLCSVSAPLLDALQLLMLFAGILTYLEPNLFSLIIYYKFNYYYYYYCYDYYVTVVVMLCCS